MSWSTPVWEKLIFIDQDVYCPDPDPGQQRTAGKRARHANGGWIQHIQIASLPSGTKSSATQKWLVIWLCHQAQTSGLPSSALGDAVVPLLGRALQASLGGVWHCLDRLRIWCCASNSLPSAWHPKRIGFPYSCLAEKTKGSDFGSGSFHDDKHGWRRRAETFVLWPRKLCWKGSKDVYKSYCIFVHICTGEGYFILGNNAKKVCGQDDKLPTLHLEMTFIYFNRKEFCVNERNYLVIMHAVKSHFSSHMHKCNFQWKISRRSYYKKDYIIAESYSPKQAKLSMHSRI